MSGIKKYGTFAGVYTPSLLTILGVIMYMRMGAIVGNSSGIWMTIGIILLAHLISISTGLSVSSVATDKKIKAGGIYYMLSRSLGFPIGGAIGVAIFVATSLSISLYLVGFSESILSVLGWEYSTNYLRVFGGITLVIIVGLAFISTSLAMKAQYLILAVIGLSLLSIIGGAFANSPLVEGKELIIPTPSFALLFGIFFPAVTGFTAGVAMSGDLKNPTKSIPWGTMLAIGTGLLVYLFLAIFVYYFIPTDVLKTNKNAIVEFALVGFLVVMGIWGATLSSALGGILGAPRILQAMSVDRITPQILSKGVGANNEPRNALIVTALFAFLGIMIGELNAIAEVVAMLYMTAYLFINLSCFLEQWAVPDFRPTFKIPLMVSGVGSVATLILMFQLNIVAAIVAIAVVSLLFFWLTKKQLELGSGDVWNSVWSRIVRTGLKNLQKKSTHKRNWEPNVLLFSGGSQRRKELIQFSKSIAGQNGMISNFDLIENQSATVLFPKHQQTQIETGQDDDAIFYRQQECQNVYRGIENIANSYGFSGIDPNTVLMGWARNSKNSEEFTKMTDYLYQMDLNVLFLDYDEQHGFGKYKTLDIWWTNFAEFCDLSLHLSKLMLLSDDWSQVNIRVLYNNLDNSTNEYVERIVQSKCANNRISAEVVVVNNELEQKTLYELVRKYSKETDLIFLELPGLQVNESASFVSRTNELLEDIGTSLIFRASSHFYEDINLDPALQKEYLEMQSLIEFSKKEADFVAQATQFEELNAILEDVSKRFYEGHFQYSRQVYHAFDEVYHAFVKVLDGIESKEGTLSEIQLALNDLRDQRLVHVRNTLKSALKDLVIQDQEIIDKLPDTISLLYPQSSLKELPTDSQAIIKVKRRISKDGGKVTFPLKKVIDHHFRKFYLKECKKVLNINGLSGFMLNNTLLKSVRMGMEKIDFSEQITTVITKENGIFQQSSKSFIQKWIQKIVEDVENIQSFEVFVEREENYDSQEIRYLLQDVSKYPDVFLRNQKLLTNQLSGAIQLESLKNKFSTLFVKEGETLVSDFGQETSNLFTKLTEWSEMNQEEYVAFDKQLLGNSLINSFLLKIDAAVSGVVDLLSEELDVINDEDLNQLEFSQDNVSATSIAFKKTISFALERDFIASLSQLFHGYSNEFQNGLDEVNKSLRLLQYQMENTAALEREINEVKELVSTKIKEFQTLCKSIEQRMEEQLSDQVKKLHSVLDVDLVLSKSSFSQSAYFKSQAVKSSSKYIGKTRSGIRKIDQKIDNAIIQLRDTVSKSTFEYRTKGLLNLQSRLGDFVSRVGLEQRLQNQVPYYYQQLFSGKQMAPKTPLEHRSDELKSAVEAMNRWSFGSSGALLFTGELQSGKTYVKQNFLNVYATKKIVNVRQSSASENLSFEEVLRRATGSTKDADAILNELEDGTIVDISDLEFFWMKGSQGAVTLSGLLVAMKKHYHRLLFVMDCNIHFYNYAKHVFSIDDYILSSVVVRPLNTPELKEIILNRHQAGGLKFFWNDTHEDDAKLRVINRMFTRINQATLGNVGSALHFWLGNVSEVENNVLVMDRFDNEEISFDLKPEWELILYQILMRKSMSLNELTELFSTESFSVSAEIENLLRSRVVEKTLSNELYINSFAMIFVVKYLRKHQIIV